MRPKTAELPSRKVPVEGDFGGKEEMEAGRMSEVNRSLSTLKTRPTSSAIVSDRLELVSYCRPSLGAGGDLWNATLTDGKLQILIGDATGSGRKASFAASAAKSCFATLSELKSRSMGGENSVESCVAILNEVIWRMYRGRLLMTLCLIEIDLNSGELTLVNAGHENPVAILEGQPVITLARGEPLGFALEARYSAERLRLSPGDKLLLYTDGITEARDASGSPFGERTLRRLFEKEREHSIVAIKDTLLDALKRHEAGGTEPADDRTFVLFEYRALAGAGH